MDKLEFATSQVSIMQQELSDLQPELIKTSADTEKLMVKIENDTVEVEAKKEVHPVLISLYYFFTCFGYPISFDRILSVISLI